MRRLRISAPYLFRLVQKLCILPISGLRKLGVGLQPAEIVKILISDGFFLTQTLDLVLG
jgi:hypothetical protein